METFTEYRFINQKNNKIIYRMTINDDAENHIEKLEQKQQELSWDKNIPYMDIYYEAV